MARMLPSVIGRWSPWRQTAIGADQHVTRGLRADETSAAPADRVAIGVEGDRSTRPIAAWASHRIGLAVSPVNHIARRLRVVAWLAVGDGAADDCTGDDPADDTRTDPAAIAAASQIASASASRLIAFDRKGVTFKWKDYRIEGRDRYKLMTQPTSSSADSSFTSCRAASTASATTACWPRPPAPTTSRAPVSCSPSQNPKACRPVQTPPIPTCRRASHILVRAAAVA